jgi:hypothetical protein
LKIKEIEDKVLNFKLEGVRTFVVGAGLLYGQGEDALENYFKAAWLQDPFKLPITGDGENLVPAIHVNDLATFVVGLAESPPEAPPKKEPVDGSDEPVEEETPGQYFFAFDGNKDRSLHNLIQSISSSVGSGEIQAVEYTRLIKPNYEYLFKLNLWALPSPLLIAVPNKYQPGYVEPADQGSQPIDPDNLDGVPQTDNDPVPEPEDPPFEWHAKGGIIENGRKVLQEFSKAHSNII